MIGISTEATEVTAAKFNASFEETAAFLINHGAGHNAGLDHGGDVEFEFINGFQDGNFSFPEIRETRIPSFSVMSDANDIYRYVNPSKEQQQMNPTTGYKLGDYISTPNNQGLIKKYCQHRFGNHPAMPSPNIKIK